MKIDATQENELERTWSVLARNTADVQGRLPNRWTLDFSELGHDSGKIFLSYGGRTILTVERDAEYREWRVSAEAPEVAGREGDVIGMVVRAADALTFERTRRREDADLVKSLDALRPATAAQDLIWMAGPAESVLHDAFTSGPFPDKGVAVAWAEAGHVLVGKRGGRAVRSIHLSEHGEVEIPIVDLADRLAQIAGKNDDGPKI